MKFNLSFFLALLLLSFLSSCSSTDRKYSSFVNSWNDKCPISIIDGEVSLNNIRYSEGNFYLTLRLNDKAPVTINSLNKLNDEYRRRIEEADGDYYSIKEIGGGSFVKGVIFESTLVTQLIDTISLMTSTVESTQGWVPLTFVISDGTDSLSYQYNNGDWFPLSESDWLNSIMPVEMCVWTTNRYGYSLPPLNDVVKVSGIPQIKDGVMKIDYFYWADPFYTETGNPMNIKEVKEKYFNEKVLKSYIKSLKEKSEDVTRFLNACSRRGISIQFNVNGAKDGIDYDLASPEFIKKWESWGGDDSITIEGPF